MLSKPEGTCVMCDMTTSLIVIVFIMFYHDNTVNMEFRSNVLRCLRENVQLKNKKCLFLENVLVLPWSQIVNNLMYFALVGKTRD